MKKKYIFLVAHGGFQSKGRMHAVAGYIADYHPEHLVIAYGPGSTYVTESAAFINEKFHAPMITSALANFSYINRDKKRQEKQGNQTLAFLTHTMTQEDSDAIALVGNGDVAAGVARAAQLQYLSGTEYSIDKRRYFFKPGDLLVIDIERKVATFYENSVSANLHSSAK